MKATRSLLGPVLILSIYLTGTATLVNGQPSGEYNEWNGVPASEIHRVLSELKASGLLDRERMRSLVSAEATVNTQTNYDVGYYDIGIRIDDTAEIIYGSVGLAATATETGVEEIQIDFHYGMTVDSIVSSTGQLGYARDADVVTVTLDRAYAQDEPFGFVFFYHGHPVEGGLQAFSFDERLGSKVISTLSEPYFARTWWPCKDRMDDKADSFHIAITVDTTFYCGSNGILDSTVADGNAHTLYYRVGYPMATYLFSLAISDYTVWYDEWVYNNDQDTMPLVHAVYPDKYDASLIGYGITPYALTVFSENYGQYPFALEKYGHANFEWGGAMEHQTMSSMTGTSFGFSEPVVVHELAHQWWGDMITCESWADIWLNEGWASYSEALYYLNKDGWPAYHTYMAGMDYTGGGTVYCDDTTDVWRIFHSGLSYDKGAWVIHMLRGVLGDSLFFEGVDAYYNSQYQHGAATTEEFRDVFETATGVELDWFFEEWIWGTYRPNYHWAYYQEPSDTGGYELFLRVEQEQSTPPTTFTMPIDFFFDFTATPDDTVTLFVDERVDLFRLNLPDTVLGMELDAYDWVMKYETHQPWYLFLVTLELVDAERYQLYDQVVEARGGNGDYTFVVTSGSLPPGLSLEPDGVFAGVPLDTGLFTFTVYVLDEVTHYSHWQQYTLQVKYGEGVPGDVNVDGEVNVADVTGLVAYLFGGAQMPSVPNLADVNATCNINIIDLTYLVAYLFGPGSEPQMGCVE